MKKWAVLAGFLALAACESDQDKIARANVADDAACKSYGLVYGTRDYSDCRQNIEDRRFSTRRAMGLAVMGMKAPQAK